MLSDLDLSRHHPLCEEQRQPSSGSAWPACQKKRQIEPPLLGAERFDTICTTVSDRCDSSTDCRVCRLEPIGYVVWSRMLCRLEPRMCRLEPRRCRLEPMLCRLEPMLCRLESINWSLIILQVYINGIKNKLEELEELKLLIHDTHAYTITIHETKFTPHIEQIHKMADCPILHSQVS